MAIHVGDIGTVFIVTLTRDGAVFDVSTASVKRLIFQDCNNRPKIKTATFTTNGSDGKIQYTTIADDIDIPGPWRVQAVVTIAAGTWSSDLMTVDVVANLA